jgi:hypothetical protein
LWRFFKAKKNLVANLVYTKEPFFLRNLLHTKNLCRFFT